MMNPFRSSWSQIVRLLVPILLLWATSSALAYPLETVVCPKCSNENVWSCNFCVNCGSSLETAKSEILTAEEVEKSLSAPPDSVNEIRQPHAGITRIFERETTNLPRLFNIPTSKVLASLRMYATGGGALGIEKERSLFGRIGLGLGDIADVEIASQSVINALAEGSSSVPTSAFKVRIMRERRTLPGVSIAIRGTVDWHVLEGETSDINFETRLTRLYAVASKRWGPFSGHLGASLTDVRVKNPHGWSFADPEEDEIRKNLWTPFAGFLYRANESAFFMGEVEGLPSYRFREGGTYDNDRIENVWVGVIGVRFFFAPWFVTDTGVRYRSDFVGIADASIQGNATMLFDFARPWREK